jgi:hypothetical protein
MDKRSTKLQTPEPDDALRVGDFALLPVVNKAPVITSHPLRNLHQETWISPVLRKGKVGFKVKSIQPNVDTYTIRKGTALTWGLYCTDPSNVNNINDLSNLTFVWRRDGLPLHEFNRQNEGRGVQFISYTEEECTEEIDGTYTCEVSNNSGTTTSVPFVLRIIDLDNTNKLYTNLLLNSDGEGGLDGWLNQDGQIRSIVTNFGTYNGSSITTYMAPLRVGTGSNYLEPIPYAFRSNVPDGKLFYGSLQKWINASGDDVTDLTIPTDELTAELPDYLIYASTAQRHDVIPNEDYGRGGGNQGFFPGYSYIDTYNQNSTQNIRLEDDMTNRPLTYFGRENIRFESNPTTEFTQTIDVSDLQSMIEGSVGGVDYLTAQFFCYIGCAISRYTIKATVNGEVIEYNYYIQDLDTLRAWLAGEQSFTRINPDRNTPIQIIPHTDDTTAVVLEFLNSSLQTISTKTFEGPTALDVWSIKEKTDWILTLYPLFQFFNNNNNPIQVFGQTYSTTQALSDLFQPTINDKGNLNIDNAQTIANNTADINAKFILQRYAQYYNGSKGVWRAPYPTKDGIWENNEQNEFGQFIGNTADRQEKAYSDKGASAFFAVGGDVNLPPQTTQIRVRVQFTNNSPATTDTNPQNKGWNSPEIYNTLYNLSGTAETTPSAYFSYGTPRCGITKMRMLLVPNRDIASPTHTTYAIPPSAFTTLGLAKQAALSIGNDATQKTEFEYRLFKPNGAPIPPDPTVLTQSDEEAKEAYRQSVELGSDVDPSTESIPDNSKEQAEAERLFTKDSIDVEETDRNEGDSSVPPEQDIGDEQPPSP